MDIRKVAKYANVSTCTVSRTINNTGCVALKTREKIEAAIKKLNYRPNPTAVALRSGVSKIIAVVLPSENSFQFFLTEVIDGLNNEHYCLK